MSIPVACQCGKRFAAPPRLAGKAVRCPSCSQPLQIPGSSAPAFNTPQPQPINPSFVAPQLPAQQPAWTGGQPGFAPSSVAQPTTGGRTSGKKVLWIVLAIVGGGFGLMVLVCCGSIAYLSSTPTGSATAKQPFNIGSAPIPQFPHRGQPNQIFDAIDHYYVQLGDGSGYGIPQGHNTGLNLYLPAGEHAPGSLPCVLITGAGTPLFYGYKLGNMSEYSGDVPEFVPYAQAGFAVVAYDMDGPVDESQSENDNAIRRGYVSFAAAGAGVVNGRNAYEFLLQKVPEVDPKRVYSAGHSSAGAASLLLAAHEPRLAGAIAYAPCYDLPERLTPIGVRALSALLPKFVDFSIQCSPKTHESRIHCPIFLFHASDDSNVPASASREAKQRMEALGINCTYVEVPAGEHYDSMIEEGIPAGIKWLKSIDKGS